MKREEEALQDNRRASDNAGTRLTDIQNSSVQRRAASPVLFIRRLPPTCHRESDPVENADFDTADQQDRASDSDVWDNELFMATSQVKSCQNIIDACLDRNCCLRLLRVPASVLKPYQGIQLLCCCCTIVVFGVIQYVTQHSIQTSSTVHRGLCRTARNWQANIHAATSRASGSDPLKRAARKRELRQP